MHRFLARSVSARDGPEVAGHRISAGSARRSDLSVLHARVNGSVNTGPGVRSKARAASTQYREDQGFRHEPDAAVVFAIRTQLTHRIRSSVEDRRTVYVLRNRRCPLVSVAHHP